MNRDRIVQITERIITLKESHTLPMMPVQSLLPKAETPLAIDIKGVGISAMIAAGLASLLLVDLWPTF